MAQLLDFRQSEQSEQYLVYVSDIFYFFLLGEVRGSQRRQARGGVGGNRFLLKIPGGGGGSRRGRGRRVCVTVVSRGILGGG